MRRRQPTWESEVVQTEWIISCGMRTHASLLLIVIPSSTSRSRGRWNQTGNGALMRTGACVKFSMRRILTGGERDGPADAALVDVVRDRRKLDLHGARTVHDVLVDLVGVHVAFPVACAVDVFDGVHGGRIDLHHMANHSADLAIRHLCDELNTTATLFPGTNLRLVYDFVSEQNP